MSGLKCDVAGYAPSKILSSLFFAVATLFLFSESVSLKGKQLVLLGQTNKYVSLANKHVPELCAFTVCIDLNKTEDSVENGTAFSYDISSPSTVYEVELALFARNSRLQMFLLGRHIDLREHITAYKMHQICCVWDGRKRLLELFWDGRKLVNKTLSDIPHSCLRPNGMLVMGHLHKNYDGKPILESSFVGILHYFQMWNYVRGEQEIKRCDDGNEVSWRGNYWSLNGVRIEDAHHQRCGTEESTSVFPPITPPDPTATVFSVTFYSFQMNFSMACEPPRTCDRYDAKKLATNWFKKQLDNSEFVVTNHYIKATRYSSKAIVKATSDQGTLEIMLKLQNTLCGDYTEDQLSMSVKQKDTNVNSFDPESCPKQTVQSNYKGIYTWPKTVPPDVMTLPCETNQELRATRACLISIKTEKAYWRRQNVTACPLLQGLPNNIMDLKNVTITEENAEEVADHILSLLSVSDPSKDEIEVLMSKLTDIANCEEISLTLARKVLQIINIFMEDKIKLQDVQVVLNKILRLTEQIGFKMDFSGRNESIVLPRLALAVLRPDPMNFQGVAFGIVSYTLETNPQLSIHATPFTDVQASIYLPRILKNYLGPQSFEGEVFMGIQFTFFGAPSLFEDNSLKNKLLNTYVVGASIENKSVQGLKEPLSIVLHHRSPHVDNATVHCVFWDFSRNDGLGGWNTSGCEIKHTDRIYTICSCNHLTHFGVLLDLSRTPLSDADEWVLTLVTYVGCGISSIFLGLALLVYLSIDKVREDHPSKILINVSFALLVLNLVFLLNSWLAAFQKHGLCITAAAALHYFLLSAFTWMGLEAINMYYALVRVLNTYIPHYMLRFAIAGWGIPAVIVIVVLTINKDFYGTEFALRSVDGPSMLFCWIQDNWVFYISVVGYFILVFLINVSMFVTVLWQIRVMKANSPRPGKNWSQEFLLDLKRVTSLTFLLGLTWGFAFFAWGPMKTVCMYIFAICNSLQGFFIFVFYCLMKENVRKQCQVHFCCGKFRLSNFYWTSSTTMLGCHPQTFEREQSCHSLKSFKSCTTGSTSNGSESLPEASPDVGVETE
ncbi:adhesion G-protein coupled receptor G4 [Python bivittatus]|uniref:Adhesion G-protein coupled receptor G4 n=1 Tax=Python bivittatus TaxID=176946 RepID=A0A9F5IET9_PYTBI|nr:adhesion G-protein coupled receptor G4 [Python bivittatus]